MKRSLKMHRQDTVATALDDLHSGDQVEVYSAEGNLVEVLSVHETITFGNKIALYDVAPGAMLIKYGAPIGTCFQAIEKGTLVHVHNVKSTTVDLPASMRKTVMEQMNITDHKGAEHAG